MTTAAEVTPTPTLTRAEIESLVRDSLPAAVRRTATGGRLRVFPTTPKPFEERIISSNSDGDEGVRAAEKRLTDYIASVESAVNGGSSGLAANADLAGIESMAQLQSVIKYRSAQIALAQEHSAVLRPAVLEKESAAAACEAEIEQGLAKLGFTPETVIPNASDNVEAAKARFTFFVRSHPRVRALLAEAEDARLAVTYAAQDAQHAESKLREARALLTKLAISAVGKHF